MKNITVLFHYAVKAIHEEAVSSHSCFCTQHKNASFDSFKAQGILSTATVPGFFGIVALFVARPVQSSDSGQSQIKTTCK
jgi:hypothetical protein